MSACGEPCPDETCGLTCVAVGAHGDHLCTRQHLWDNEAELDRIRRRPRKEPGRKTSKQRVNDLAMSIAPERRAPALAGPPPEAVSAWNQDAWVARATQVLREFCEQRREDFTTPEHVWPLLPTPREMRAMVLPVRSALRQGWIAEVGAVRLTGVYHTADGDAFRMNKFTPVYRSLISKDA